MRWNSHRTAPWDGTHGEMTPWDGIPTEMTPWDGIPTELTPYVGIPIELPHGMGSPQNCPMGWNPWRSSPPHPAFLGHKPQPIPSSSPCAAFQPPAGLARSHLAEDLLGVRLQLGAQLHARQVRLQQQVGLDVGVVEFGVGQFVGHLLGQLWGEGKPFSAQAPDRGWNPKTRREGCFGIMESTGLGLLRVHPIPVPLMPLTPFHPIIPIVDPIPSILLIPSHSIDPIAPFDPILKIPLIPIP